MLFLHFSICVLNYDYVEILIFYATTVNTVCCILLCLFLGYLIKNLFSIKVKGMPGNRIPAKHHVSMKLSVKSIDIGYTGELVPQKETLN